MSLLIFDRCFSQPPNCYFLEKYKKNQQVRCQLSTTNPSSWLYRCLFFPSAIVKTPCQSIGSPSSLSATALQRCLSMMALLSSIFINNEIFLLVFQLQRTHPGPVWWCKTKPPPATVAFYWEWEGSSSPGCSLLVQLPAKEPKKGLEDGPSALACTDPC